MRPLSFSLQHSTDAASIANNLVQRIFVTPFQVSTWHYLFAQSESYDRSLALPFAKKLFGKSINVAELVYQKYGTIFSKGDKTSTSTSPAGSLISYPAHFGYIGIIMSSLFIIVLDYVFCCVGNSSDIVFAIKCGFVWSFAVNLISSDFVTTLITHGTISGFFVVIFASLITRHDRVDRFRPR